MRYWLTYILLGATMCMQAHTWWIGFTDKQGTTGELDNPSAYLSQRAIARREKQHIPIDSTDLPVSGTYLQKIAESGCNVLFASRWNNGVVVSFPDSTLLPTLLEFDFVDTVELTQLDMQLPNIRRQPKLPASPLSQLSAPTIDQIRQIGLQSLHDAGFMGQGMQIAVIDNGFYKVDELEAFNQTRQQILLTKDFVSIDNHIYRQGAHGTMVFSTIAGYLPDKFQGTATKADYYLFRTEDDDTESIREVDAQVAAFELADSLGADIITTSLGYGIGFDDSRMNISYQQLDGRTMRNSKAATIAARKGMIVCVSMGNEGNSNWQYLLSPADADSILTVGSVNRYGVVSPFSSYGPTADNRTKPDLCALGSETAVINVNNSDIAYANGTSFSTPVVAGMVACLWSALPCLTNMQLIESIRQYASNFNSPNASFGYGIPNAWETYMHYATKVEDLPFLPLSDIRQIYNLQGQAINLTFPQLPKGLYIIQTATGCYKIMK